MNNIKYFVVYKFICFLFLLKSIYWFCSNSLQHQLKDISFI